ncbi:MAG TPA: YkgJ family cysteine cluster protein [Acidobacteriota bacterium]|nr:YkgJ family cysteine cluster protein [Acidobacteriota bacterium]
MRLEILDRALIREVDRRIESASRAAGDRLACKPGCTMCCIGLFTINLLDAFRLARGLAALEAADPGRAAAVRQRAGEVIRLVGREFPGDPETGWLDDDEKSLDSFVARFSEVACPALDPATGLCDLYEHRPMVCRTFGLPILHDSEKLPHCSLCFRNCSKEEIENYRVEPDPEALENAILCELWNDGASEPAARGRGESVGPETIMAYALAAGKRQATDDRTDESRATR